MKQLFSFVILGIISCTSGEDNLPIETQQSTTDSKVDNLVKCPKGHTDSIIPIEYGFPSEEMFEKADSGLIILGGCELGEFNYYCKKHEIEF